MMTSDLGARAVIISVVWISIAIALSCAFSSRIVRDETLAFVVFMMTLGGTVVSLVVWLTKWPRKQTTRGFEVMPTPVVPAGS